MDRAAYEHNGRPVERAGFYAIACDPHRHVAVEACAGAGKTWMLVSRIVRALLAGVQPHEILAITFTRKAAGEMRQRLQEWLAHWSAADDATLQRELQGRGLPPTAENVAALRGLYAQTLRSGRPVQIRTFHSWFAALLRGAPVAVLQELGLPARYELLEDDKEAIARVWRRYWGTLTRDPGARRDFEEAIARHGRFNILKALESALAKRVEFGLADARGVVDASVQHFGERFPEYAALEAPELALATESARQRWHERSRALGAEKNKTPQKAADAVVRAFEEPDAALRLAMLRKAFFVASEDRLTAHLAKLPVAQEAEGELQRLCGARAQHEAWLHHARLSRLARLLLAEFAALKREQGWVDMSDVERAAHRMLSDPVLSGWVQEQLDARVRQLLIDEFQDTNALQWQALHAWLAGYAGAGGDAPALFIVGDPKQSIYRFRRAEPEVFVAAQRFIGELGGDLLACDHTHRNAPEVLAAVNTVMEAVQRDGLYRGFRVHTTESTAAGALLALPAIPREPRGAAAGEEADEAPAWRDSLTQPRESPEEKLVTLEARQAAAWIAGLVAQGCNPGDLMVLARRRERLSALEAELRNLQIPAQQPEKVDLCEAPEVQDIVALVDALVSPGHDLSLARALRSPIFGCSDEDLVVLATRARAAAATGGARPWRELLAEPAEAGSPALAAAATALQRWQAWVDKLPPHDALQLIYDDGDVLPRFARAAPPRLREAVLANLRAVLGAALAVAGGRYLTPYAFVRALKAGGIRGPAVAAAGVVRLLTVHGAKGLQAPIVLMLDTDAAPARAETMGALCVWPAGADAPERFAFLASESSPPSCCAGDLAEEQGARSREELNALYVAMTRAQRQLVISSVAAASAGNVTWWQRLQPLAQPLEAPAAGHASREEGGGEFLLPVVPVPALAALRLEQPVAEPEPARPDARVGEAMHRLLETWRPGAGFAPARLRRVAQEFALAPGELERALELAECILAGAGAWAWDAQLIDWHDNEVALAYGGDQLRLDRLVRRRDTGEWWVLDYKSTARPERQAGLQEQLRRYRAAVQAAMPDAVVRTAFLTGDGRLVAVP